MSSYVHQGPPASNASQFGPPTANDHLRESMHGSINWKERQMFNSYADPGPDIVERRWPFLWSFLAAMAASAALWLAIIWALGWLSVANAAERDPERPWVVWLVDADKPWLNPRNNLPATATGPHACNISRTEITKALPSGTRLSCLKKPTRGE